MYVEKSTYTIGSYHERRRMAFVQANGALRWRAAPGELRRGGQDMFFRQFGFLLIGSRGPLAAVALGGFSK